MTTISKPIGVQKDQRAINKLIDSSLRGELVAIIGTGVSMSLTNNCNPELSWKGLIRCGFDHCVDKGLIKHDQAKAWEPMLVSNDIDDLLAAAEFFSHKLKASQNNLYSRWIQSNLRDVKPANTEMEHALKALKDASVPICTLNYDALLEQVTGLDGIIMDETTRVFSWMNREIKGILHLHGSCFYPETCILGIRDYETTLKNDVRDLIQRSLATFRRLLFIGCGDTFVDPNFNALIKWLKETLKTATQEHYALVTESDVNVFHTNAACHGFVEPISYGVNYQDLPSFLLKNFPKNSAGLRQKSGIPKAKVDIAGQTRKIKDYLTFLIKDCGQMTIEGVRADMEIGQRKFDIERLFVPLEVQKCPPEILDGDPNREQKILQWEKNNKPCTFGKVLEKNKRIALLALPGGGKTLLLKRLAVAYSDPGRRLLGSDDLPDIDVVPVLIRCREWRDYIQKPILTILKKLPEISGDNKLSGLAEILIPLFKKGRILLLVDGLDEIHDNAHRTIFVEHLESFIEKYNLTRLIVTSRVAGFDLVAPCISRFCDRWGVAPLNEIAISTLCDQWQSLMIGNTPQIREEGKELAEYFIANYSLRRLAENPLLLTMLLVVKHGSGNLPPDRVSLYKRAVDVLLDTWNIKGHDPLNPKEAVPQLAYVAFQMMKEGKQTVTEKELLSLIEEGRDNVPQIKRYAKDTPYEFLKRVELRSGLLIEAGHKVEVGQIVPFYQFRHLTFQEYLVAVAAVEGHYIGYTKNDSVLTPLEQYLISEDWKEIVPMAAVLARKQAEPLIAALVRESEYLSKEYRKNLRRSTNLHIINGFPVVFRLVQCLAEEAEASPETLTSALRLTAYFTQGYNFDIEKSWLTLFRGPYGMELMHQAWLVYISNQPIKYNYLLHVIVENILLLKPKAFWLSSIGLMELKQLLNSSNQEEIGQGIFIITGLIRKKFDLVFDTLNEFINEIGKQLENSEPAIRLLAVFSITLIWHELFNMEGARKNSIKILDRILALRLHEKNKDITEWSRLALSFNKPFKRNIWKPNLTDVEIHRIRIALKRKKFNGLFFGDLIIAFHAGTVLNEDELIVSFTSMKNYCNELDPIKIGDIEDIINQIRHSGLQTD